MSDSPEVTVILPAYNAEKYIREAVDSIRSQTYDDYEVVAVDDGSTDSTGEILDELAADFSKMTVIHQENRGLAAARNAALASMKGQYVALLDSDDIWLPDKLKRCMDFLKSNPDISIVYTPMDPFDSETGERMEGHSKKCHSGWLTEKIFMSIFVHDPAAVFHRRVTDTCGGFDESIPVSVGNEFWLRVSTRFEFGLIDESLALRRWSESSLTRSNRLRGRKIKAAMLEEFYFRKDGTKHVPRDRAMRRLAKVYYHLGKAYLGKFECRNAFGALRKAIGFRPLYLKVWFFAFVAMLGSVFR